MKLERSYLPLSLGALRSNPITSAASMTAEPLDASWGAQKLRSVHYAHPFLGVEGRRVFSRMQSNVGGDEVYGGRRVLALIPARGGSKGLHAKNLRRIEGRSLVGHAVHSALLSIYVDLIYVSSDDDDVLKEAARYGSHPHVRHPSCATDNSTANSVVHDFLSCQNYNISDSDLIAYLQPTSPLRTPLHIDRAMELMGQADARSVISVEDSPIFPQKLVEIDESGTVSPVEGPADATANRQALRQLWKPNGAIYLFSVGDFRSKAHIPVKGAVAFRMTQKESVDVDCEEDLILAQVLMRERNAGI